MIVDVKIWFVSLFKFKFEFEFWLRTFSAWECLLHVFIENRCTEVKKVCSSNFDRVYDKHALKQLFKNSYVG